MQADGGSGESEGAVFVRAPSPLGARRGKEGAGQKEPIVCLSLMRLVVAVVSRSIRDGFISAPRSLTFSPPFPFPLSKVFLNKEGFYEATKQRRLPSILSITSRGPFGALESSASHSGGSNDKAPSASAMRASFVGRSVREPHLRPLLLSLRIVLPAWAVCSPQHGIRLVLLSHRQLTNNSRPD